MHLSRNEEEEEEISRFLLDRNRRRQGRQAADNAYWHEQRNKVSSNVKEENSFLYGDTSSGESLTLQSSRRGRPSRRILLLAFIVLCISCVWVLYAAMSYALPPHPHIDRWSPQRKPGLLRRPAKKEKPFKDPSMPSLASEQPPTGPVPEVIVEAPTHPLSFAFPPSNVRRRLEPMLEYEPIISNSEALEDWVANGKISPTVHYPLNLSGRRYDVVFTTVNGSDWEHRRLLQMYSDRKESVGKVREFWSSSASSQQSTSSPASYVKRTAGDGGDNRFREIDELRYAVRSAYHGLQSLSTIHLLTPSFFPPTPFDQPGSIEEQKRLSPQDWEALSTQRSVLTTESGRRQWGQLPQWLQTNHSAVLIGGAALADKLPEPINGEDVLPKLRVHHDWSVFEHNWLMNTTLADSSLAVIAEWKEQVLPTFNSIAIESMLGSEKMVGLADTFVHANDDMFFGPGLTSTDFSSPLFGPILRFQADLLVFGSQVPGDQAAGEWPSLEHSAWLLDQRFGPRGRPYIIHLPRAYKTSLLRELRMTFAPAWRLTAESRFRNENIFDQPELSTHFLMAHFVVERYREALLWSFFVLRMDDDSDGYLTADEISRHLLRPLGAPAVTSLVEITALQPSFDVHVPFPYRSTLSGGQHLRDLDSIAFPSPGKSEYDFVANEGGYPHMTLHPFVQQKPPPPPKGAKGGAKQGQAKEPYPRYHPREGKNRSSDGRFDKGRMASRLSIASCLSGIPLDGSGRYKADDVFKRWAFERAEECGDPLIVHLLGASGTSGMSAVLPSREKIFPGKISSSLTPQEPHLPLTPHWNASHVPNQRSVWFGEEAQKRLLPEDIPDFSLFSVSSLESWSGLSQRSFALRLLMRYQYTIASSPSEFFKLTSDHVTQDFFGWFNMKEVAFLCLNDDYRNNQVARMKYQFQKWAKATFPLASPFEKWSREEEEEGRLLHLQQELDMEEKAKRMEEEERIKREKQLERIRLGKSPDPPYIGKG